MLCCLNACQNPVLIHVYSPKKKKYKIKKNKLKTQKKNVK